MQLPGAAALLLRAAWHQQDASFVELVLTYGLCSCQLCCNADLMMMLIYICLPANACQTWLDWPTGCSTTGQSHILDSMRQVVALHKVRVDNHRLYEVYLLTCTEASFSCFLPAGAFVQSHPSA
jgi:hypothetical protein